MKYEVQQYTFCQGWINTWSIDEEPEIFSTYEEARIELMKFMDEIQDQIQTGEREPDNGFCIEDFRIVKISD